MRRIKRWCKNHSPIRTRITINRSIVAISFHLVKLRRLTKTSCIRNFARPFFHFQWDILRKLEQWLTHDFKHWSRWHNALTIAFSRYTSYLAFVLTSMSTARIVAFVSGQVNSKHAISHKRTYFYRCICFVGFFYQSDAYVLRPFATNRITESLN